MDNNDIMRRLRYALDHSDAHMLRLFALAGDPPPLQVFLGMLTDESEPGHVILSDEGLGQFLDGLIHARRGPPDPNRRPPRPAPLDNNLLLRKLRIAFTFTGDDMLRVLEQGGMTLSSSELSAFFRKPGSRQYRQAGNQVTRAFLQGLAEELRGSGPAAPIDDNGPAEAGSATQQQPEPGR